MNRDQLTQASQLLTQLAAWEKTAKDYEGQVATMQSQMAQASDTIASIRAQLAALGVEM